MTTHTSPHTLSCDTYLTVVLTNNDTSDESLHGHRCWATGMVLPPADTVTTQVVIYILCDVGSL